MKTYQAYNLYIASELELPELEETQGEPDVIIRVGLVDNVAIMKSNDGDYFTGEIPEVAKFCVQKGCSVIVEPLANVDKGLLSTIVLGPVLCLLLRQRGLLVLHASAVNINGKAVAFMGGSGWGKSTLATAFHTQGYNVLSDDVMPIQIGLDQPIVFPAYPQFKVWREAATSLGHDIDSMLPIYENAPKLSYKFSDRFQNTPLRLHRIYILDKGDVHQISSIHPQEAFVNLIRHSRAINSLLHQHFVSQHLYLCTQLIKQVSFRSFTRKPALEDLPELVKMIVNDVVDVTESKVGSAYPTKMDK